MPGVHRATLAEVAERFGSNGPRRAACTQRLLHIVSLARQTGFLQRTIIFGSYVTTKTNPNDVDIILIMDDDFRLTKCPSVARGLFDHAIAQARYGASIFWIRPGLLLGDSVERFVTHWQIKRDGSLRGIVEVVS